jgi:hypothetical protein
MQMDLNETNTILIFDLAKTEFSPKNFKIKTPSNQSNNFFVLPSVPYPDRLCGVKITRIHEVENLTLGYL